MAANLTVAKDDIKDVTKFMDECRAMRMSVLPPDVNESGLYLAKHLAAVYTPMRSVATATQLVVIIM